MIDNKKVAFCNLARSGSIRVTRAYGVIGLGAQHCKVHIVVVFLSYSATFVSPKEKSQYKKRSPWNLKLNLLSTMLPEGEIGGDTVLPVVQ